MIVRIPLLSYALIRGDFLIPRKSLLSSKTRGEQRIAALLDDPLTQPMFYQTPKLLYQTAETMQWLNLRQQPDACRRMIIQADERQLFEILHTDGLALAHIQFPSYDMLLTAVQQNPYAIHYVDPSEQTPELQYAALGQQTITYPLQLIDHPHDDVVQEAVRRNPYNIGFVQRPGHDACLSAYNQNPDTMRYVHTIPETMQHLIKHTDRRQALYPYCDAVCPHVIIEQTFSGIQHNPLVYLPSEDLVFADTWFQNRQMQQDLLCSSDAFYQYAAAEAGTETAELYREMFRAAYAADALPAKI